MWLEVHQYPDRRDPMFQLVFESALFAFTIQIPAFDPLFRFPRDCHQDQRSRSAHHKSL